MAETYIFQTRKDFRALCEFLINKYETAFWVEKCFDSPNGLKYKDVNEIEIFIKENENTQLVGNSFFLTSKYWSIENIFYSFCEPTDKNFKSYYYALQRHGGPSIHLQPSYFGVNLLHSDRIIGGSISDYPYYISQSFLIDQLNGYRTIDRPEALKNTITEIKKFMKKGGKKVAYRNGKFVRTGIVMEDALREYKNGVKLLMADMEFEEE